MSRTFYSLKRKFILKFKRILLYFKFNFGVFTVCKMAVSVVFFACTGHNEQHTTAMQAIATISVEFCCKLRSLRLVSQSHEYCSSKIRTVLI